MARARLSWDRSKVAEISKQADPYSMNQDHTNNPIQKYDVGGPADFAETPDAKTPWKGEGRNEVGLPAPERAAVKAARKLEDKALKCITIAQRVLPGATDDLIEKQATDFMYLPDRAIIATLQRQAELAEVLAKSCKDEEEEDEAEAEAAKKKEVEEEEAVEAKKKEEDEEEAVEAKKKEEDEEEVEAKKKEEDDEEAEASKKKEDEDEAEASKKKEEDEEEVEAAKKKEEKEEEVEAARKKKEEEEEEVEASTDLLDQIFAQSTPKTGAKKLSGIVKQASSMSGMSLDNLWNTPPDVSKAFRC